MIIHNAHIKTNYHQRAVLCCAWESTGKYLFSAGCDNNINLWQINGKYTTLGKHKASVQCVEYSRNYNILVSGSWDKSMKFWDIRNSNRNSLISIVETDGKI